MEIRCPYCEKTVQVPGGGQFTCPNCRAVFAVDLEPQPGAGGPPPLPTPPSTAPVPAPPRPAGAGGPVCARHPTTVAGEVCKRCGNFMCGACAQSTPDGMRFCVDCMGYLRGPYGAPSSVPWETERATLGFVGAWWKTAKTCMFTPDVFFRDMPVGGLEPALGFNVAGATVFGLISQVLVFVLMGLLGAAVGGKGAGLGLAVQAPFQLVCMAVFLPIGAAIGLFIGAAINHVIVLICGGTGPFEATFRILGYAAGSTSCLSVIPYLGPLVGGFWNILLTYHGYVHLHRMSSGRAAAAALAPLLIGICCVGVFLLAFGSVIMAAIAQAQRNGGF